MKNSTDFRIESSDPSAYFQGSGEVRHPVTDAASWVWIDDTPKTRFLRFTLDFEAAEQILRFHITVDQRFQLRLDGQDISFGPDRSDLEHWRVTTCDVPLSKGPHRFEALVWWIKDDFSSLRSDPAISKKTSGEASANPPMAQMSRCGGFLFAAEGELGNFMNTSSGNWHIEDLTEAVGMARKESLGYHDIGASFTIDLAKWNQPASRTKPICVLPEDQPNPHGIRRPSWILHAHNQPEQRRVSFSGGTLRALRNSREETPFTSDECTAPDLPPWTALLAENRELQIEANREITLIWDFDDYHCGYPQLEWSGGAGAVIEVEWAESLYEGANSSEVNAFSPKNNRNDVAEKVWLGFGDTFHCSGAKNETSPGIWWRAGRYIRLRIRTADEAFTLQRVSILSTLYPLDASSQWNSSDPEWDAIIPLLQRGLELGAHETWADSPYYEQLMYTGDTRLHGLSNYTCYPDVRLTRSAINLFDASRSGSTEGLAAERYPSAWRQDSATYALIWVWMVRDHMLWCDDKTFLRKKLAGVRQMLEAFLPMRKEDGLLGVVPGWPFVDWVEDWDEGCGAGTREGDSSIVNLHLVLAFLAVAEIEAAVGEEIMALRWKTLAKETMAALLERYWDTDKMLLLDAPGCELISEHAQALAIITGLLGPKKEAACHRALTSGICKAECSIYFSFYLLEAFKRVGDSHHFFEKLAFWRGLPAQGFKTLPESPEPARSDCHGWGAHPLYHSYASIAGIRPAAPGFQKVRIQPMPGTLNQIALKMPHPNGEISFAMNQTKRSVHFDITLPKGISGELIWNGETHSLGNQQVVKLEM